jgi:hypothetical protein
MYLKYNQVFRKVLFNKFIYISFIISLIIVSLVIFNTQRINTLKISSNLFNKKIIFDNYYLNTAQDSSKQLVFIDIKNLVEIEILENVIKLFSLKSDIFLNINKQIDLNKLNFKLSEENIIYDLEKKKIILTLKQTYSFYNHRKIPKNEIIKLEEIVEFELNKLIKIHNLSLTNFIKIDRIEEDSNIIYKVISSILFLTFLINLIFSLIKYRKNFF